LTVTKNIEIVGNNFPELVQSETVDDSKKVQKFKNVLICNPHGISWIAKKMPEAPPGLIKVTIHSSVQFFN
jgi:hypothetical protein